MLCLVGRLCYVSGPTDTNMYGSHQPRQLPEVNTGQGLRHQAWLSFVADILGRLGERKLPAMLQVILVRSLLFRREYAFAYCLGYVQVACALDSQTQRDLDT